MTRLSVCLALALSILAAPAGARQPPNAPPSGIVVHLFGPSSPLGSAPGTAPGNARGANSAPSGAEILHQMFVTGDPAQENGPRMPQGRAAAR